MMRRTMKRAKSTRKLPLAGRSRRSTRFKLAGYRITGIFPGEKFGAEGKLTFTATLIQSDGDQKLSGIFRLADGVEVPFTGVSEEQESDKEDKEEDTKKEVDEDEKPVDNSDDGDTEKPKKKSENSKLDVAINYPLGAFGLEKSPQQEHVALVNATVWTCADAGMLEGATVLIESGKITAVGKDLELPEGVKTNRLRRSTRHAGHHRLPLACRLRRRHE